MAEDSERVVLLGMIGEKISKVKPKCRRNKFFFKLITAGSIAFSAAITAILGLDLPQHAIAQKNIALALGLVLTLVNSWMAVFDYKKLWVRQKSTLFGLYQIENELKMLTDTPEHLQRVNELFKSFQAVWEKDGIAWAQIYSASAENPQKSADI